MREALAALLLAAAGCVIVPPAPPAPLPPPPPAERAPLPTAGRAALHAALAEAVSEEASRVRQAHGAGPLSGVAALDAAALQHAQELARRRVLDHGGQTPGRETLQQRIHAAGVAWSRIGENLASIPGAAGHLAEDVVYLWLNSPGHRANLLNATYTHVGTGVTRDAEGHWYVVQVYVRPRE